MALTLAFSSFLSCCTTCSSLTLRVFPGGSAKKFECSSSRFVMSPHNMASKPRKVNTDIRSTLPLEKIEIFKSLETMALAEESMLSMLKPVEESWQPQDFLPDSTSEEFIDVIKELKERTKEIPDEYLICLVGNMITEEALPTYQTIINTADGFRDETGSSLTPWARWMRMWTAEENRHGDLLNKYLYLSGRCDMRQIEKTIQYLLGAGMDIGMDNSPYQGAIYSSFQERATFISHGNTARNAKKYGDTTLAKICGAIAADEKRHEMAYTKLAEMLFRIDPDTMMQAFATMMKKRITMPALLMFDGYDCNLFNHFAAVSNRLGVYTTRDYADMVEFFVKRWKVEELTELSPQGMQAQEYVGGLAQRFRKLEEKAQDRIKAKKSSHMVPFSWIFNKPVMLL